MSCCWTYLKLRIGPSWDLNYHVEDCLLLVRIERNVVERRDRCAILLDVAAVLEGVFGSNLSSRELGRRFAVRHAGASREVSSDGFSAQRSYAGGR